MLQFLFTVLLGSGFIRSLPDNIPLNDTCLCCTDDIPATPGDKPATVYKAFKSVSCHFVSVLVPGLVITTTTNPHSDTTD